MKKNIYVVLIVAILFCLSGCSENKRVFTLQPFRCNVQLLNDTETVEGIFVYEDKNSMYIDFTSDDISGVRLQYCKGEYSYISDGVTVKVPENKSYTHIFGLFSALILLDDSDVSLEDGSENIFNLSNGNRNYTYNVDGHSKRVNEIKSGFDKIIFMY